jgi:hypothetical protein
MRTMQLADDRASGDLESGKQRPYATKRVVIGSSIQEEGGLAAGWAEYDTVRKCGSSCRYAEPTPEQADPGSTDGYRAPSRRSADR